MCEGEWGFGKGMRGPGKGRGCREGAGQSGGSRTRLPFRRGHKEVRGTMADTEWDQVKSCRLMGVTARCWARGECW